MPLRLRNAPTRLMKDLGYGKDYRYAHDEERRLRGRRELLARMMPIRHASMRRSTRGLEIRISEKLRELRRLNEEAAESRAERGSSAVPSGVWGVGHPRKLHSSDSWAVIGKARGGRPNFANLRIRCARAGQTLVLPAPTNRVAGIFATG